MSSAIITVAATYFAANATPLPGICNETFYNEERVYFTTQGALGPGAPA